MFIELHDPTGGRVLINTSHIEALFRKPQQGTFIVFTDGNGRFVKESYDEIKKILGCKNTENIADQVQEGMAITSV